MRRRRRTKGTWFPVIGSGLGEGTPDDVASGRAFALTLNAGQIITAISPITFDAPQEGDNLVSSFETLSEIIGNEYVLQRIVGKIFAHRAVILQLGGDLEAAVLFGAGFFVARANDASVGGGIDTPIGSATEAERRDNYSPLETDTIREPWIWRRTWILGTAGQADLLNGLAAEPASQTQDQATASYPASTALYGSVADGPHIDSKVKRRIGQDDRLWFAVSATPFPLGSVIGGTMVISGYLDYRIFGSLRRARGKSAF